MYKTLEPFIEVTAYIVDGYCLSMLFGELSEQRIKREIFINLLTISAWFAANVAIRYFVFFNFSYTLEKSLLSFALHAGAIYAIGLCFYKGRQIMHLFLPLLFMALRYAFSEIGYSVRLFLVDGLEKLTWHIEVFNNVTTVKLVIDLIYLFMDIAVVALFYFSIKIIVRNHKHSDNGRSTKELISYILPAFMGSLVSV